VTFKFAKKNTSKPEDKFDPDSPWQENHQIDINQNIDNRDEWDQRDLKKLNTSFESNKEIIKMVIFLP